MEIGEHTNKELRVREIRLYLMMHKSHAKCDKYATFVLGDGK